MSFFEKGAVRIHYEEAGSGFPLLLIAGGGLNSNISGITGDYPPFNAIKEFGDEYRCIAFDLRNAPPGQSSGPLEIDRPWDSHTDDQLALMDHLGFDKFMVLGFCIGGPLIWNLIKRAPDRVVAGVLAMPSGSRPEMRDLFYDNNIKGWAPQLVERRPDITMEQAEKFLTQMYRTNPDFVFTVTRDFVRQCQTPVLILPDDIPAHPYAVAMESAMLAPNAEVSLFPWKEPKERVPLAVRQIRSFLRAHRPASARRASESFQLRERVTLTAKVLQFLPVPPRSAGKSAYFGRPSFDGQRLARIVHMQRRLVRVSPQQIGIDIGQPHARMLGHDMAATDLAEFPVGVLGLVVGADVGRALGDAHVARLPQAEGIDRRRRPGLAIPAMAVAGKNRRCPLLPLRPRRRSSRPCRLRRSCLRCLAGRQQVVVLGVLGHEIADEIAFDRQLALLRPHRVERRARQF